MVYDIIIVDPPWDYKNKKTGAKGQSSSSNKYKTMTVGQIKFNFADMLRFGIANEDAVLFLWTTNSFMPDAFEIMKIWGFTYKTTITWVKRNYGMGNYFRGKTEHCLLGIRGKVKAFKMNLPNVIMSEKTLNHSEKPEEFYQYIEKICIKAKENRETRYKIIELFARKQRKFLYHTWTCLGYEITGNDIVTDLKNILKLVNK